MGISSVAISVKLSYWEAYRLSVILTASVLRKILYIWAFVALLAIAAFVALLFRPRPDEDYVSVIQNAKPLFWAFGIPVFLVFGTPLLGARRLVNDRRLSQGVYYEFSEAGIHIETPVAKSDLLWSAIARVRELRSDYLIFTSPNLAYALPKRCFANSQDVMALRELFRTHVANSKLLPERD